MPGAVRVELPEHLQVIPGDGQPAEHLVVGVDRPHPAQVQQRPQQRRGVPFGQHKPVPVGPDRVGRVEPEEALPQHVGDRRDAHRSAGMAGLRPLDGVHAQTADRVDGQRVRVGDGGDHGDSPCYAEVRAGEAATAELCLRAVP